MKPRITVCVLADGSFEILMNEAGRDQLVEELQRLDRDWDHIHLDYFSDPEHTEVALSPVPYRKDDTVLLHGKLMFRPDEWDLEYFPHVLSPVDPLPE